MNNSERAVNLLGEVQKMLPNYAPEGSHCPKPQRLQFHSFTWAPGPVCKREKQWGKEYGALEGALQPVIPSFRWEAPYASSRTMLHTQTFETKPLPFFPPPLPLPLFLFLGKWEGKKSGETVSYKLGLRTLQVSWPHKNNSIMFSDTFVGKEWRYQPIQSPLRCLTDILCIILRICCSKLNHPYGVIFFACHLCDSLI